MHDVLFRLFCASELCCMTCILHVFYSLFLCVPISFHALCSVSVVVLFVFLNNIFSILYYACLLDGIGKCLCFCIVLVFNIFFRIMYFRVLVKI